MPPENNDPLQPSQPSTMPDPEVPSTQPSEPLPDPQSPVPAPPGPADVPPAPQPPTQPGVAATDSSAPVAHQPKKGFFARLFKRG